MKIIIKLFVVLILFLALAVLGLFILGSSKVSPVAWEPAPFPGLHKEFAPNHKLSRSTQILNLQGTGPEDITQDSNGYFYTGYEDGRIIRFKENDFIEEFANTGGRPLGMQFDANGNLIVADSNKGLLSIDSSQNISVLTDSVNGVKLKFTDDLDISEDGTIWFSDASMAFDFSNTFYDFIEGSETGRLLSYSPASKQTTVHLENLFFANGVALGPNDEFVLVNETGNGRIQRLWLKGPRQGQRDIFFDGLAGNPDNLSFNGIDTFWVALPAVRLKTNEGMANKPLLRTILAGLPLKWVMGEMHYGFVVGLDLQGNVIHNYQDPDGNCSSITSVNQFDNKLYLGSLSMQAACVFELDKLL